MPEMRVSAFLLKQHDHKMYVFSMNSRILREISYVVPRSKDDPEEIQRALDKARVKDIAEYIQDTTSLLPNSIVVNLTEKVRIEMTASPNVVTIVFPSESEKVAYILDGQHRVQGFSVAGGIEFDLPVVGIHNASINIMGKIFTDINSKQKPPSKVHLLALQYQIGELEQGSNLTMQIVTSLNHDNDSPLSGKIKMMDGESGTWVTNDGLKKWINPHVVVGGILAGKTVGQQTQIIKSYFSACKLLWPEAWGSKKHILIKATGFELLLGILKEVIFRCRLNEGNQLNSDTFKRQLGILKNARIEILGQQFTLDWNSEVFGQLSNQKAKSAIRKRLQDILTQADENNAEENE